MNRMTRLLMGTTIAVMGAASLASAFPGTERQGDAPRPPRPAEMFTMLDTDGDGAVSAEERAAAGPAAAFAEADANGDGALEGDELTAFRDAQEAAREARRVQMQQQRMLERFDKDEDGKLSLEELEAADRGPAAMFDRFDADEDGVVTEEEFAEATKRMERRMARMEERMDDKRRGDERFERGGRGHGPDERRMERFERGGPRGDHRGPDGERAPYWNR